MICDQINNKAKFNVEASVLYHNLMYHSLLKWKDHLPPDSTQLQTLDQSLNLISKIDKIHTWTKQSELALEFQYIADDIEDVMVDSTLNSDVRIVISGDLCISCLYEIVDLYQQQVEVQTDKHQIDLFAKLVIVYQGVCQLFCYSVSDYSANYVFGS